MRILVTGGAGFIGSALVKRLAEAGHRVIALDNLLRGEWPEWIHDYSNISTFTGDIRYYEIVRAASVGCDEVIHLAYVNGTQTFYDKPEIVLDVGVKGMLHVLEACKVNEVKRFMLASSSEVCRAHVDGMDEGTPLVIPDPYNPRYSYSAGKIISEMLALHSKQFEWLTIFRPFNVYGPGMSEGHVIPDFKAQLKEKMNLTLRDFHSPLVPFEILGSGDETRSFCYIDDLIDGVMLIRERGVNMGIYNIGTPVETTIRELAMRMGKIYGLDVAVKEGNALPEGSIKRRKPDITKLAVLGFQPKVSLDEGLRRVLCQ